jgi:hypothetical protein
MKCDKPDAHPDQCACFMEPCKCNCCIYWRRRTHRIAATANGKVTKLQAKIKTLLATLEELMTVYGLACERASTLKIWLDVALAQRNRVPTWIRRMFNA